MKILNYPRNWDSPFIYQVDLRRKDGVIESFDKRNIDTIYVNSWELITPNTHALWHSNGQPVMDEFGNHKISVRFSNGNIRHYESVCLKYLNPKDPALNPAVDTDELLRLLEA